MAEAADLCERGIAFEAQGRTDAAEDAYRQCIGLDPAYGRGHYHLGLLLRRAARWDEAVAALLRARDLAPGSVAVWCYLAMPLEQLDRMDEADFAYRRAVALNPGNASIHANFGHFLYRLGRFDEAASAYGRAVALKPDDAVIRHSLAITQLTRGELELAWPLYEARWRKDDGRRIGFRPFPQPLWRGEPLDGRRLLIWGEQGIGDELIFFGLVSELAAGGARCTIECYPRLAPLLARSLPDVEVVPRADPPDPRCLDADLQAPAADLAALLRPRREGFAPIAPYLRADPDVVAALRDSYAAGGRPLVGISWWSRHPGSGGLTSAALDLWDPILRVPGVRFVSLQYGDRRAEIAQVRRTTGADILVDPGVDPLVDMDRSAAQTAAMDLVITVDNATAATASTLGRPVWTLVSLVPAWGMGAEAERTPWHATMRLFRQPSRGDWSGVAARVAQCLATEVRAIG